MGDEEIRASLEGQDGSTFSMISHCNRATSARHEYRV